MKTLITLLTVFALSLTSCTQQERAKKYGGTATEKLAKGRKLINVTWKDSQLWVLTRPMHENDVVETYEFKEFSSWGVLEGTVKIEETK